MRRLGKGQRSINEAAPDQHGEKDLDRRDFLKNAAILGTAMIAFNSSERVFAGDKSPGHPPAAGMTGNEKKLPLVRIPDVSILMKSPDSVLVGIATSDVVEIKLADVMKVHGYCGGSAFSFRAAQEAFKILYPDRLPLRQFIKVQTSIHCCQADALAYITGARTDLSALPTKGDLVLIPEEKNQMVFIDKLNGNQVILKPNFNPHDTFSPLYKRMRKEPGFAPQVQRVMHEKIQEYIYAPQEKLFQILRA
ncbi:Tat (twin-arginine translocation) pathway signal sequence [Syntrophus gentianae]|uniref:Tat (Twin-arginine translocation) pathway signal sequence n=1 Tax=Syntrophus gentianae TaxID=43775 RepID=A0A1H7Y3J2_9BACT|nr:FmdE family protein [Syntrophus gentianae]SEM39898.1 Tat (twin-arginine translocation) pathway signal sequence [Syntrophus gentianae]